MLKGTCAKTCIYSKQAPLIYSGKDNISVRKDSIHTNSLLNRPRAQILNNSLKQYTKHQLDSIFKSSEKREKLTQYTYTAPLQTQKQDTLKILVSDTQSVKHSLYNYPFTEPKAVNLSTDNFMACITHAQKIEKKEVVTLKTGKAENNHLYKGKERIHTDLSWFTIAIIASLYIFAFIKNVYNKFILQIITSLIDYQVANRLYRERNVLFRNVSIGLHAIFYINAGLFVNFIMESFHIQQIFNKTFQNIAINCLLLFFIYNIKSTINKIIGYVFLVQEEFAEYIHNVNLFNKNIGLCLFPIVILYPFVNDKIKPVIVSIGIIIFSIIILLRFYRGFQIIMRKGASVFYLILYLCTIEILPVVLLVKLTSTLI